MEEQNFSNQNNQAGSTLVDMQRFQKKKSKNGRKILIVFALIAIVSAAVYYFFFFNKNNAEPTTQENNSNVSEIENKIDKNLDSDSDELPDYMEKILGTGENNADTDGDGYSDFEEIKNGYNPLNGEKYTEEEWYNIKEKIKGEDEGLFEKKFGNFAVNSEFACGVDTVSDIDGNTYNTVQIGSQCWLKENFKATKNPEGVSITRYCYDNDPTICETDGGLYNWNTAMSNSTEEGAQGICPNGWHVPKDSEWYILENYLNYPGDKCVNDRVGSGCSQAGTRLQIEDENSYEPHSGFDAIKAGLRLVFISNDNIPEKYGSYIERNRLAYFWTSSEKSEFSAWHRLLPGWSLINREAYNKEQAFSIRCLKN